MSVVTLFYCLFMFNGWQKLFRDSDTGWHIRAGESILETRALPATDPYSFTRGGQPWLDWEWASDVISGAAHRAAGPAGVAALFAAVIASCTWLWFKLQFAADGDFLLACIMTAPMLSTVSLHWLARPHVFGWVLLLIFVLYLEKRVDNFTWRDAVFSLAIGVVWANLHGSFFLGPLIAGVYWLADMVKPLIWNSTRVRRHCGAIALLTLLGTLANPYGTRLHVHVFRYLIDSELLQRIGEFQTFNFHAAGSAQILIVIAVAAVGAVAALSTGRLEHSVLIAILLVFGLRSARGLPLAALIALPLANGAITEALRRARGLAQHFRRRLDACLAYSARLRTLDCGLSGIALAPFVLLLLIAIVHSEGIAAVSGFPASEFPVAASAAVANLPWDARILAPDKFGGYLIYRFRGERRVYFDGRSDFYGAAFMKDYIRLIEARPGWREQVPRLKFTHALLPDNYSLIPALEQSGWRMLYKDATATLLAAPEH
jgi:hypothetical protein